jgi:hypothetical protein
MSPSVLALLCCGIIGGEDILVKHHLHVTKIHASDANGKGGGGKDIHDTVISSVSGGVEASFKVVEATHPA